MSGEATDGPEPIVLDEADLAAALLGMRQMAQWELGSPSWADMFMRWITDPMDARQRLILSKSP